MAEIFTIEKIKIGNDTVKLTVNDEDTETKFVIFTDDFLNMHLFENQQIDRNTYDHLKSLHYYCYTYSRCLRKMASHDLSRHELLAFLDEQNVLDDLQKKAIMDQFVSLGYIDDARLVESQFENDQLKLYGRNKTRYNLLRRGIDEDLVREKYESISYADELSRATRKTEGLVKALSLYSERQQRSKIYVKLYDAGFDRNVINEAIGSFELYDPDQEKENIQRVFKTGLRRFAPHFSGRKLRNKLYVYLSQKGYRSDVIESVLEDIQEEENED